MFRYLRYPVLIFLFFQGFRLFAGDYNVTLKKQQVTSRLKGYCVEKVINASRQESCIGFVQKGMLNRQEPAFMAPGIAEDIGECLKRSFPGGGNAKPLIVRINHLYIYELTWSSKEIACVELSLSFITKDSAGYVDQFLAGISYEKSGLDVTGMHPKNITAALGACFDDFYSMIETGKLQPQRIPATALNLNPPDHPEAFAVFQKMPVPKGLFGSFYSFRDGRPDTLTGFTVEYHRDKKDSTRSTASLVLPGGSPQKKYYGFSDGKNLFVWAGKEFVQVAREGNSLSVWVDLSDIDKGAAMDAFTAGTYGGMVGGLITALASGVASAVANDHGQFTISFISGSLRPVIIPDYLKAESHTVLYLSDISSPGSGVTILYGTDTLCTLLPANNLKLSLPVEFHEVSLLFTCKDCTGKAETLPLRLFNTSVYLVRIKRNGEVAIGPAYEQVRKDILYNMNPENTVVRRGLSQKSPVN